VGDSCLAACADTTAASIAAAAIMDQRRIGKRSL
jgi:hypothetical protein